MSDQQKPSEKTELEKWIAGYALEWRNLEHEVSPCDCPGYYGEDCCERCFGVQMGAHLESFALSVARKVRDEAIKYVANSDSQVTIGELCAELQFTLIADAPADKGKE